MASPWFYGAIGFAIALVLVWFVLLLLAASIPSHPPARFTDDQRERAELDRLAAAAVADLVKVLRSDLLAGDERKRLEKELAALLFVRVYCRAQAISGHADREDGVP